LEKVFLKGSNALKDYAQQRKARTCLKWGKLRILVLSRKGGLKKTL